MKGWGDLAENHTLAMLLAPDGTRRLLNQCLQLRAWRAADVAWSK